MIESLRTTQRWVSVGSGGIFVQGKIVCNHFGEHRFSVPDPRVFPPPTLLHMMTVFLHRRPKTEIITRRTQKGVSQYLETIQPVVRLWIQCVDHCPGRATRLSNVCTSSCTLVETHICELVQPAGQITVIGYIVRVCMKALNVCVFVSNFKGLV